MWTYPEWPLWTGPQPARPSEVEMVLARLRHPSFTPDLAESMVRDLSRRKLRRLLKATDRFLEGILDSDVRLHVVVLREQLLDRLYPVSDEASGHDPNADGAER